MLGDKDSEIRTVYKADPGSGCQKEINPTYGVVILKLRKESDYIQTFPSGDSEGQRQQRVRKCITE